MSITNPYHDGELAVQQRVNASKEASNNGAIISATIRAGALRFIEQQPMLVIGSVDLQGRVWISVLVGNPGFFRALDDHTLELDVSQSRSSTEDPLWLNIERNPNVGILVIELATRRRIRINGCARKISTDRFIIEVERAYPNCPKYIQRRVWKIVESTQHFETTADTQGTELNISQRTLISVADTFFVASAHPDHGVDASHRGGHPGFVTIVNNRQLRIPDYVGNNMFNTLGNFVSYPYAGLVFIDFKRGRLLQLTGHPKILWQRNDPQEETGGTHRYWLFNISGWRESSLPIHFTWEFLDASPYNPIALSRNLA